MDFVGIDKVVFVYKDGRHKVLSGDEFKAILKKAVTLSVKKYKRY